MPLSKLFQLDVGFNDETSTYQANVYSIVDKTVMAGANPNLRKLLTEVSKNMRKKEKQIKLFPLPQETEAEPSRIILAGTNGS